jgi:hypothetical protein
MAKEIEAKIRAALMVQPIVAVESDDEPEEALAEA